MGRQHQGCLHLRDQLVKPATGFEIPTVSGLKKHGQAPLPLAHARWRLHRGEEITYVLGST